MLKKYMERIMMRNVDGNFLPGKLPKWQLSVTFSKGELPCIISKIYMHYSY